MRIRAYFTDGEWTQGEIKAVRRSEEHPERIELAASFRVPIQTRQLPDGTTALVLPWEGGAQPRSWENVGIELDERDCHLLLAWLQNREHLRTLAESADLAAQQGRPKLPGR